MASLSPFSSSVSEFCNPSPRGKAAVRIQSGGLSEGWSPCSVTSAWPCPYLNGFVAGHSWVRKGSTQCRESTHRGRGAAGHQGACLGCCLQYHHQVRRKGVQVDAGDHASCEVHQGIRKEAVVQVEIGPMKPGRGKVTTAPVATLVRCARQGGCPPDICILPREGMPDLHLH